METQKLIRYTSLSGTLEILRSAIVQGTYKPGQQLKQNDIASSLGVSQGPVREALIQLATEGLIENIPYKGTYVLKLTKKDVVEIYELRYALEALAIKLALPEIKNDLHHRDKLNEYLVLNELAEKERDYIQAVEMDLKFHEYYVKLSNNSRLIKFWDSLLSQAKFTLMQLYEQSKDFPKIKFAKNHQLILAAFQDDDYDGVCSVLKDHMEIASTYLSKLV